jgi:hypothetical protein
MIEAFIAFAFGAGGMWLWMRANGLPTPHELTNARTVRDTMLRDAHAAHSRCSDSLSVLHDKIQSLRSLCSNRKDSTAIAAMKIIGGGQ